LCNNTVALSIQETDEAILSEIEGEVLGTRHIDELLALVASAPDPTAHLQAERDGYAASEITWRAYSYGSAA
jgi:hypothetical protein